MVWMDPSRQRRTGRRAARRCSCFGWLGRLAVAAVLVAAAAAGAQTGADGAALVGVDPEDETYRGLSPGDTFVCSDGSVAAVPFERLNDGFCDCRDGSDEPGTGVCQGDGGRFFCPNTGFKPERLFASRVNDGICDCCDGSDEYDSEARCSNTCAEMAAKWNAEADAWAAVVAAGIVAKQSYVEEASEAFATLKKHLRDIGRHIKEQTACAAAHAAAAAAEEQGTALQIDSADDEGDDGDNDSTGGDKGAVALDASCELDEERLEMLLGKQKEFRNHITVFGADFAWYPLAQKCVEFNNTQSGEYIYAVCPFDKVVQAKPDRSNVVILGQFFRWAKGTEPKRKVMLFGQGERCYNGPLRSTKVEVACGPVDKVESISEPGMCQYEMRMTTPAACDESLLRVRYGPEGPVAADIAGVFEGLKSGVAQDGDAATASDVGAQNKIKQEL